MARQAIRNALFFGTEKYSKTILPWCTYTDPEIAHVGKYPKELEAEGVEYDTYQHSFDDNDRAICEGAKGLFKVHCKKGSDTILGATIVGGPAGDMICSVTQAMQNKVGLSAMGKAVHPYPTYGEIFRTLADKKNRNKVTPVTKSLLRTLIKTKL